MATCGELLVRLLEAYGVELVFGIPGVHTVELYRGLPATRIRHITPRHEQGAGFMADGYARVTGKPGVCFIVTGPGMTNILTAMGQAYADSVPMLVISSVNRREHLAMGDGRLHELPSQRNLAAGAAAFSHTLLRADQLPQVLARAFAVFASARPRPVHIEIPIDVIAEPLDPAIMTVRPLPSPPAAPPASVERARLWLANAKSPLVILGGGAVGAAREALALVEFLDAPVVHTVNAKGILPPGHPLWAGQNMAFAPIREAIGRADVVLAVGTEFGETEMYPDPQPLVFAGKLIRVDIDPEQLVRGFPATLPILSDARSVLSEINGALGVGKGGNVRPDSPGARRAAEIRHAAAKHWWPAIALHQRIARAIQESLPNVIIVGDSAEPVYALNQCYESPQPRSYFTSSTGYGTLGYALPAGVGAQLAAPDRPVVALVGDGGFQFTVGELAAAVEAKVPLIVLLWNNEGYGEIKSYMIERQIAPIGVDIFTPDFLAIAKGFGCQAARAESFEQLAQLLKSSVKRTAPTLIEIRADAAFLKV
ncbi:MAG TPA: 5-guanidino-2-oxopentanoate decarboxylase [Alphaproteobacteria bacterium]|nr:5-guanidino-2-oxopentanoate decarboxylase [Alphaproteobacteria bacterium]